MMTSLKNLLPEEKSPMIKGNNISTFGDLSWMCTFSLSTCVLCTMLASYANYQELVNLDIILQLVNIHRQVYQ